MKNRILYCFHAIFPVNYNRVGFNIRRFVLRIKRIQQFVTDNNWFRTQIHPLGKGSKKNCQHFAIWNNYSRVGKTIWVKGGVFVQHSECFVAIYFFQV